jgi:hypothetical protein
MFKKTYIALLISCISASSYAYEIKSNLTVENKTNISMVVNVEIPNIKTASYSIPPYTTGKLDLSINGWELYKYYPANLTIKSNDVHHKLYVQGRVNYYVGAWPTVQYNSLDALSAADGLTIDSTYSCFPSSSTFENKIVIVGAPGSPLNPAAMPIEMHCQGFKSSVLQSDHIYYTPTCSDGKKSAFFWKILEKDDGKGVTNFMYTKGYMDNLCYDNGMYCDGGSLPSSSLTDDKIKEMLDNIVRRGVFCGSW